MAVRGERGAPHRVGGRVVAAAITVELYGALKLVEPATKAACWEALRGPASGLLGSRDASRSVRAGPGDAWIGNPRLSGLYHKPLTVWNAVSAMGCLGASRVPGGRGCLGAAGPPLQVAPVTVPQFTQNKG